MLYVTTREKYDAFTTARTLASDYGPKGGLYLPYKLPRLSAEEVSALKDQAFGHNVAMLLNLFLGSRLTGWDVEFCIGRYPVKVSVMGQKVAVAECWRNLEGSYEKMERQLAGRICDSSARDVNVTSWLRIAIRIAVLAGIFGELQRQGITEPIDVSVPDDDFCIAMAVWYGRCMGLPVANIICGCGEGSDTWNLIHNGQLRGAGNTATEPERLVYETLGVDACLRYVEADVRGGLYSFRPDQMEILRKGLFAAVVSNERMVTAIPNVYRTNSYILDSGAAVSYSALMDYRARTGESRCALLIADQSPADTAAEVAAVLNISQEELKELLG